MPVEPFAPALDVAGVSHSFGRRSALRECTFAVPAGAVTALVGRNGAGKSTLLQVAAGLVTPDSGRIRVFGQPAGDVTLPRIGYVAQRAPLYPMLTVRETLALGGRLNPRWDTAYAQALCIDAALPARVRVGSLGPGQRTRLALIMALAKRPGLLLLDEPLASLDPISRAEVAGTLMADVAEHGTTVLVSSHVVADIDGVCDHLVVLADGAVRLAADVESALAGHLVAVGDELSALAGRPIVEVRTTGRDAVALVRSADPVPAIGLAWHRPTLEELILGYLRAPAPHRKVVAA